MDGGGHSFDIYRKFLDYSGYTKCIECCIGSIEVWQRGDVDVVTFSIAAPNIPFNRMPDLVSDAKKEMKDFYAFLAVVNGSQE